MTVSAKARADFLKRCDPLLEDILQAVHGAIAGEAVAVKPRYVMFDCRLFT